MQRLSSNATLFLKLFLPVFTTTVLTGLTLVAWFDQSVQFDGFPIVEFRYAMLFTLALSLMVFWLLLWPLKRVETDGKRVYVSDYFRTASYRWDGDVEALHESPFFLLKVCTLELNGVGTFGRKMHFVASRRLLRQFRSEHPFVIPGEASQQLSD